MRVTSIWDPASPNIAASELTVLNNLTAAGKLDCIDVYASVYNFGSKTTPLSDADQASFAGRAADLVRLDVPENRLERQDIVLTVPASFDAVARELTVEAARAAGLENLTLLEEPQAAFYAWIDNNGTAWREKV